MIIMWVIYEHLFKKGYTTKISKNILILIIFIKYFTWQNQSFFVLNGIINRLYILGMFYTDVL